MLRLAAVAAGALCVAAEGNSSPAQRRLQANSICADISGDGIVGVDDLLAVLAAYGTVDASADLTGNPTDPVDVSDLLALLGAYGSQCTQGGGPPPPAPCDSSGALNTLVPFLSAEGGATDIVAGAAVTLLGGATVEDCGLRMDGDGDRAEIANFDYSSDGSWTVGFWFSKHMCTTGPWEYVYSHAASADSILSATNPNINAYIGCSSTASSFMRTIVVADDGELFTYDMNLAGVGNFDAVTQAWVYMAQSWSPTGATLVIDGVAVDGATISGGGTDGQSGYMCCDGTNPASAANGGTLAAFAGAGYAGSTMATDIFIGGRSDGNADRHFSGLIAGVGISATNACEAAMTAWFTNFEATINIPACIVPETTCGAGATTTGGSVAEGSNCVFPFTYNGVSYNECTAVDNGATEWCALESTYASLWGNCVCDGSNADDTYDSNVATYNWVDISDTGIQVALTDWTHDTNTWASDDGYVTFDLPFVFPFYEVAQSQVSIGTNGYITFGTAHYAFGNSMTIPTPAGTLGDGTHASITVDAMIAMLWCDLDPSSGGATSAVYVQGTADAAVASYVEVPFCCGATTPSNTFQIILFPTGSVKMNYMTLMQGGSQQPSIGYEDANGARGEQIAYGWAAAPADASALSITPTGNGALPADPTFDLQPTYVVAPTSYQWTDIARPETAIALGDWGHPGNTWASDDGFVTVDLAFTLSFFGMDETQVSIGTNGYITFGAADHYPFGNSLILPTEGGDIGGTSVDSLVGILWCDLDPSSGGATSGVYQTGNNYQHIISYVEIPYCCGSANPSNTFQIFIYAQGTMIMQYQQIQQGGTQQPSIGFENHDGKQGQQVAYGWTDIAGIAGNAYLVTPVINPVQPGRMISMASSYAWEDITGAGAGTAITNSDWVHPGNTWASDDGSFSYAMPFSFPFYGILEPQVDIGTNGYITFGSGHYTFGNSLAIPVPGGDIGGITVDGMIAVCWSDMDPSSSATPDAAVFYHGSAVRVVVSYVNVAFCCGSPTPDNSFQVALYPSGAFTLSYDHLAATGQPAWGPLSIGYENNDGTIGEQLAYGWANAPADGSSIFVLPESMALYVSGPTAHVWQDITSSGTAITNAAWTHDTNTWASDDGQLTVPIGFDFMFYGIPEAEVSIGTNGYITFGAAHYAYGNSMPVPTPGGVLGSGVHEREVDSMIAVMWSDMDPSSSATPDAAVFYGGDANSFVISYVNVAFCCGSPTPDNSFQAVLGADGSITLNYDHLATSGQPDWGPLSIGYENGDGSLGEQLAYDWANAPGPSTSILVSPPLSTSTAAPPPPDPCNGGSALVDNGMVMRDGYGNNENCIWDLTCSDGTSSPTLTFSTFQTESNFDFVFIYNGAYTGQASDAQLHGSTVPTAIQVVSSVMAVRFVSDGSVSNGAFSAAFSCDTYIAPGTCANTDLMVDWVGGFHLAGHAVFGAQNAHPTDLDNVQVVVADPLEGCVAFTNAAAMPGMIALIQRGTCAFTDKVLNAQNAGAVAVVLYNNQPGTVVMGGDEPLVTIPAVMIAQAAGDALNAAINADVTTTASIHCGTSAVNTPDACSAIGMSLTDSGDVFKADYGNDELCTWTLTCSDATLSPVLTFSSFDVEGNFDFVYVYNGIDLSGGESSAVATLHGTTTPGPTQVSSDTLTAVFASDGSVNGAGFTATFSCEPYVIPGPSPCSGGVSLTDNGDVFKSNYGGNELCTWNLTCSDPLLSPMLTFSAFDLEGNFDYLNIYDPSELNPIRLHGVDVPAPVTVSGNNMLAEFDSDFTVHGAGFVAVFTCIDNSNAPPPPPDACTTGLDLVDGGAISYVGASSQNCRWALACTDTTMSPLLTFSAFDTEDGWDFLYLFAGSDLTANPEATMHGTTIPDDVTGSQAVMTLLFVSDNLYDGAGFDATFTCAVPVPAAPGPCTTGVALLDSGDVSYGAMGNDQVCTWIMTCSDAAQRPQLTFTAFDIEGNFDFLRLYDAVDDSGVADLSLHGSAGEGSAPTVAPSTPVTVATGQTMVAQYVSDGYANGAGFVGSFDCVTPPSTCPIDDLVLDWTGGMHTSGHAVFTAGTFDIDSLASLTLAVADPLNGCVAFTNAVAMPGKIALIQRGACAFTDKVQNAQDAGAIAAVVYNNEAGLVSMPGTSTTITIPAIFISIDAGSAINAVVTADPATEFSLHCAAVSQHMPDPCGATGQALINSGEIIVDAQDNQDCTWGLSCLDPADQVTISFSSFDTENNFDWVNVYESADASGSYDTRFSGAQIPDAWTSAAGTASVRYVSDASFSGSGFAGSFQCAPPPPPPNACNSIVSIVDTGSIAMPLVGGIMANNDECTWELSCSDATAAPVVTFATFQTENNFDWVNMYAGVDTSYGAYDTRFSGGTVPAPYSGNTNAVTMVYNADQSVNGVGFTATVTCAPGAVAPPPAPPAHWGAAVCDAAGIDVAPGASFASPNYNGNGANYDSFSDCRWNLVCPTGTPTLTFTDFQTEANWDFVKVDTTGDGTMETELDGAALPGPLTGIGTMLVQLQSDSYVERDGFDATFTCL